MKDLLQLLHDTFLRKRDNPYPICELRNKLVAEPYGLPACTLPLFSAVAIRHEMKRLRWGGTKEPSFAKNLVDAFTENNKLTIRLFEFSKKQFAMLFIAGRCMGLEQLEGQSSEEYAAHCASKLREFINSKPQGVKSSNKLDIKTQELVKFLNTVGQSAQDLADFLINLLGVKNYLPDHNIKAVIQAIQDLFDDFLKVENAKLLEIQQSWYKHFPENLDERKSIISRLYQINTRRANQLAIMLEQANHAADIEAKEVIYKLLDKQFDESTDSDIGQCIATIDMLFEQAKQPVPVINKPDQISTPVFSSHTPEKIDNRYYSNNNWASVVNNGKSVSPESVKSEIQSVLHSYNLPKDQIIQVLELLLKDYTV